MELSPNIKQVKINNSMRAYGRVHSDGTMEINLKKGDVVDTIIHENLHLENWQMPHGKVYKTADKVEGGMSLPEMAKLLLDTHEASQYVKHEREITHTTASKVVSTKIK